MGTQPILSWFPCNEYFFRFFGHESKNIAYSFFHCRCCLIVLLEIPAAVVLSVHTCVMGCGWTIYYNFSRKMMISLPVTKHPPVYASVVEAATNFKILLFTYIGPFRRSRAYFEGILPEKIYSAEQLRASGSVRYDASVLACKSFLKREI